mmetsp:Transcript_38796/g.110979  ORF Transcript_38796/g.110979 Transcript_38796/m.110979 type:complete len:209 (-) Transcript_38796:1029-1655(-)
MHLEVLVGELEEQFGVELLRQQGQYLHLLDVLELRLPLPGVLQVALNAHREVHVHLVVLEVPAEVPELLRLLLVQAPQLRQAARDAADHVGEADQSADHHGDRVGALWKILRLNIHGRGSELRQRPMQASGVHIAPVHPLKVVVSEPTIVTFRDVADRVPEAANKVTEDQQEEEHGKDVHRDVYCEGIDPVLHHLPDLLQPRNPGEPH